MNKIIKNKFSIISLIFIPIIFLWHPNWLGFLGVQPYWPLFWLLPWSMINGSINGLIFGLFLGLILDSLTLNESFTQLPGLIICGFLFGRIKLHSDILLGHFRYGLICSFGSFLCGTLYFLQILFRNFSDNNSLLLIPSIKNITLRTLKEIFLRFIKFLNDLKIYINFFKHFYLLLYFSS